MTANGYLASARGFSIGLLVITYLAYDLASFQLRRNQLHADFQTQTARYLVVQWLGEKIPNVDNPAAPRAGATLDRFIGQLLGGAMRDHYDHHKEVWKLLQNSSRADLFGKAHRETVSGYTHTRFKIEEVVRTGQPEHGHADAPLRYLVRVTFRDFENQLVTRTVAADPASPYPLVRINQIASRVNADLVDAKDFHAGMGQLYRKINSRVVAVPGTGHHFSSDRAIWVLVAVGFTTITLIRNRVRCIYQDPQLAVGEPWLVLDGHAGLERFVAWLWAWIIFFCPWIIGFSWFCMRADQVRIDDFQTTLIMDAASYGFGLIMMIGGGWQSLGILAMVVTLRQHRAGVFGQADPDR